MNPALRDGPRPGQVRETAVGRFVTYYIDGGRALSIDKGIAVKEAQRLARAAGLKPIDVAQATDQGGGDWLVELMVA